jgi:outer membrane protein assembly factor BamB
MVQSTPENVGYRSENLQLLDNLLIRLIDEKKLQCSSYLLSRNGKIFAYKSMGKLCGFDERGDLKPEKRLSESQETDKVNPPKAAGGLNNINKGEEKYDITLWKT